MQSLPNFILRPVSNKALGKRETLSKFNTFAIFEFSEDEIRTGAQIGCAFFQLCIKELFVYRKLALGSAPRRLIGAISPGCDVKDLDLHWLVDTARKNQWYETNSHWFTLGVLGEEGHCTAPCSQPTYCDHAEEENAAKFVSRRFNFQDIACESAFGTYRSWLRRCDREHDSCGCVSEDWAPLKLVEIDWHSPEAEPRLRLVHGSSMASATLGYLAVSSC